MVIVNDDNNILFHFKILNDFNHSCDLDTVIRKSAFLKYIGNIGKVLINFFYNQIPKIFAFCNHNRFRHSRPNARWSVIGQESPYRSGFAITDRGGYYDNRMLK